MSGRAHALMVLGTASHVGKSLLTAALCRILKQDGYRVAPFKSQNMSLNSAATPAGGEIGRAQALQAEAAGIVPTVDMNPVLLKPTSDRRSQVIVSGRIWATVDAFDYHRRRVEELFPLVCAAYERLAAAYDIVLLEGAGSPAEINLRSGDIANMRMAHAADAGCVLVGDIDRGGVFASLYGTLALLDDADRSRIMGTIVNKFRGDPALFASGAELLETMTERPCFGVVPYLADIGLEEEDSVAFDEVPRAVARTWRDGDAPARRVRIAVVVLPQIANVTDFDALRAEPGVELVYAAAPEALGGADLVVLPGTKSTLAAVRALHETGMAPAVVAAARSAYVFGICGGLQLLGRAIADPDGVEGGGSAPGLGLLPVDTTFDREKVARRASGVTVCVMLFGAPFAAAVDGYEIHVGRSTYGHASTPFARITRTGDGAALLDGAVADGGRVAGTYLHGIFADDAFRHRFLRALRAARGLNPAPAEHAFSTVRHAKLDRLADHVRAAVDIRALLGAAGVPA